MRRIYFYMILFIFAIPPLKAQEKERGFELEFSLVHPAKWSMNGYNFSTDPTLEVLYFIPLSGKFSLASGIFMQAGKHSWQELYGHTFYDETGMPYRLRTNYNRQLKFFSLGIPVKIEMEVRSFLVNSVLLGFTAGNHLKLSKADYLSAEYVEDYPVTDYYNSIFWELNFGFRKNFYRSESFTLSISPFAGYRKESARKDIGYYNYIFYGLGFSLNLRR